MSVSRRDVRLSGAKGALMLAAALIGVMVSACGGGVPASPPSGEPTGLEALSGNITIDGSSTVFPITEAVAEEFGNLTQGRVRVTVGVSGTGGGFKKFCNQEADIINASRPIKASEMELCAGAGVEFIELPVAIDGLSVLVNPSNDFVQCLTVADLKTIWAPEAEDNITRWNQVRPEWPDSPLHLYGPGVDSGTFDYFTDVINGEAQASRGDFTSSENDNVLVQGISGDVNSLGYFGYSYYVENAGQLKGVPIDGGSGCVPPTDETINNGAYAPLSRPLFVYLSRASADLPRVKEFARFYLSAEGQALVAEVGYIPFPPGVYELVLDRLERGLAGTIFGGDDPGEGTVESILSANR